MSSYEAGSAPAPQPASDASARDQGGLSSQATDAARKAALDEDSDDPDLPEFVQLDEAAAKAWREEGTAAFKAGDPAGACVPWIKAARAYENAHQPDAKLCSNIAAAQLSAGKFVAAAMYGAKSIEADGDWWKGHWYRGQALIKMAEGKQKSTAMGERVEQGMLCFKQCLKTSTLPADKRDNVEAARKGAEGKLMEASGACQQS